MLTKYFWNMDLAESLFPTLHAVEVALRNTLHATLTSRYPTEEWWHEPYVLKQTQHDHQKSHGITITPGRLVSTRSFGFWTPIVSHPYESRIWRYKRFVLIDQAFPYRGRVGRHAIHQRFNDIRLLRNRVMHRKPIHDRPNLKQEQRSDSRSYPLDQPGAASRNPYH